MSLDTGSLEACAVVRLDPNIQGTTGSPQLHPSATLPAFPASTTHSRDIPPFERKSQHTTTSRPDGLYMDRKWFHHRVFRVKDWSVFRRTVRTNNDVEGMLTCQLSFLNVINKWM